MLCLWAVHLFEERLYAMDVVATLRNSEAGSARNYVDPGGRAHFGKFPCPHGPRLRDFIESIGTYGKSALAARYLGEWLAGDADGVQLGAKLAAHPQG